MAVLVTGGAGYIGSHMVWDLLDAGEKVVVVDRLSSGFEWAVPAEAPLVVGDIGDMELIAETIRQYGVDSIIHFAGSIVVPESVADPLGYYENNSCKSRALIETAVRNNVRHMIFSSTAAVYGETGSNAIGENDPVSPVSPYGVSKLMTEWMLRDVSAAHDLSYAALRYFNVAGADPLGRAGQSTAGATHLIKVACETALGARDHIEIFGDDYPTRDGTGVRDYIHVSDLVSAHRLALGHLRGGGANLVVNCGYGNGYSVREVVDCVKRVSGRDFQVLTSARRAGDPPSVIADPARIRKQLGWLPQFDKLELIIAHALAWENSLAGKNSPHGD